MRRLSINPPTRISSGQEAALHAARSLRLKAACDAWWEEPEAGEPWVIFFRDSDVSGTVPTASRRLRYTASVARNGTVTKLR